MNLWIKAFCVAVIVAISPITAFAAVSIPFTVNLSENVTVDTTGGTPRIAVDVGGVTRYATYTAGTGTSALTFTYGAVLGDVDLDGVTLSSPIDLSGGTIRDAVGNNATLTFTPPNTTGVRVNYPSLSMDFVADADGRYTLNGTVHNNLSSFLTAAGGTFSRSSIGTYYDSTGTLQTVSGNTPRFDHDPVTLQPKGILIEENRTNVLARSNGFDNAVWTAISAKRVAASTALSPSGQYDAYEITDITASYEGINQGSIAIPNNSSTYSISIYVLKTSGGTASGFGVNVFLSGGTLVPLNIRLNTDTGMATGGGASVSSVGAWWRLHSTIVNNSSGNTSLSIGIFPAARLSSGGADNPTATGVATIYGAQIEVGAFPTSYIPTTTAAVTRNADSLLIPTGGWYNAGEGTLFSQATIPNTGGSARRYLSLNDGTINESIQIANAGSTTSYLEVRDNITPQVTQTAGSFAVGALAKIAGAYKLNNFALTANGASVSIDTSGTIPSVTQMSIGSHPVVFLNGNIQKVRYYPARLSNTQLQLMTQ